MTTPHAFLIGLASLIAVLAGIVLPFAGYAAFVLTGYALTLSIASKHSAPTPVLGLGV